MILVLGALAVGIGAVTGWSGGPRSVSSPVDSTLGDQERTETVAVHVSGLVSSPGVVDVPADAIVAEAIEAAGGFLPGARVDQINLASPVVSGEQIIVPGPDQAESGGGAPANDGPLSLNRATAGDLETLPGVGPVLAERIVSFREDNGRLTAVEDLLEVPGIGEAKLEAIRDLVRP